MKVERFRREPRHFSPGERWANRVGWCLFVAAMMYVAYHLGWFVGGLL